MKTLAIDTSSHFCSVAVFDNDALVMSETKEIPRLHNVHLLNMIDALLSNTSLDKREIQKLAYGVGPGSFVGVRLAAAVMQGFSLALDLPVRGFSSMALAAMYYIKERGFNKISVLLDAKMGDAYIGNYIYDIRADQLMFFEEKCIEEHLVSEAVNAFKPEIIVGESFGLEKHYQVEKALFDCKYAAPLFKDDALDSLSDQLSDNAMPVYLQGTKKWKKLSS
ncbi:tRNA (adenosine(37)-N6)-threonylcarbamoyltransferase complex dimerization subunit type 1 TsaB [Fangia hongkongensis]|uniref:tRNA (adenosine(37)-N6)-threonylcarbamoyltransferase complex dimerization subunit type 1 TsaB n=1 Tax=Fangia hongkongensis TaxID=270495 RepID=UPI00037FE581|nr:tRNA (adenosine(37)-N6)-threonylcarbamoyltransferase complex dimerization subunit type 1 TsaB [Fangia hongkongensis]MBK2124280.1 tRNA (adenosine(37)-N6)-threonylcarbamoyltransferase complex dimerization subunit type 1 TsaB [Fangia hongkongensis]